MNELSALIRDTAAKIFRDLCPKELVDEAESGQWPEELWRTLEDSGLTQAAVPEEFRGSGGTFEDAMTVLRQAGEHAAPLPLAETFLAGWVLAECGCNVPSGPLALVCAREGDTLSIRNPDGNGAWILSGSARRVPWASKAVSLVVIASDGSDLMVAMVEPDEATVTPGSNLAGDPRDDISFNELALSGDRVRPSAASTSLKRIEELGALTRAVMMAGAMRSSMRMTLEHANTRLQFGRPIGSFQGLRLQLAVLAGQVAASVKAADVAVEAAGTGGGELEIAVAKARVGEAVGTVAEITHQAHGAMGITYEHALHQYTRRLWSWRDEFGSERIWQETLGKTIARGGGDNLWKFISQT